jgi:glycosyltransferase involved in cell wall biosynthesis
VRVCLYSNDFWPSIGGIETMSELLAEYLAGAGVDVTVVTRTPLADRAERDLPYSIVRRPARRALLPLLRGSDVLHASCMGVEVLLAARWTRTPIVVSHQAYSTAMEHTWRMPRTILGRDELWRVAHARASELGMRLADRNVCVSEAARRALRPPRGSVIYNAARVGETFRPLAGITPTDRFAFVGRLVVHKGCHVLLEALARCHRLGSPFGLDVYGDGPERKRLLRLARQLGLDGAVTFHGVVEGDDLARAYNQALAVVVPSVWEEPFGIVALEAMACGRAVVASAGGGLGEIVAGRGHTFPPGDASALADLLAAIGSDSSTRRASEERGQHFATGFRPEVAGARYLALYRELVPTA